jgi:anti-anti-sigma factor
MPAEANLQPPYPPDAEPFSCAVQPERDAVRVFALGALDMATAPVLEAQLAELREAGFRRLILDLSRLDFMDSTGLRLILATDVAARGDGFSIAVVPGPPAVQRVFETTGTMNVVPFVGD